MTGRELEVLKSVDVRTVDRDGLVDIREVKVDRSLPVEERVREFVEKVKNPYCFKVGDVVVKVGFAEGGPSFSEQFGRMLLGLR